MKKVLVLILALAMLCTVLPAITFPVVVQAATADNLVPGTASTFESTSVPTGWSAPFGGTLSTSTTVAHGGAESLLLTGRTQTWYTPAYNIYSILKTAGAGTYDISVWVYVDTLTTSPSNGRLLVRGADVNDVNSFITDQGGGNYFGALATVSTPVGTWTKYSVRLTVLSTDLTRASGTFNLCIDSLPIAANQLLYFDDLQIRPSYTVEKWRSQELSFNSSYATTNYLTGTIGTFEDGTLNGWTAFGGGTASVSSTQAHSGTYSVKLAGRTQSWYSPQYNIYSIIKAQGAGTYNISYWVYVDDLTTNPSNGCMLIRGASVGEYSFFVSGQSYGYLSTNVSTALNTWVQYNGKLVVTTTDLANASGDFNLMMDTLPGTATPQNIYMDDVQIQKAYADPFNDVTLDVTFVNGATSLTMPAFWDGGNTWKVRFAPTLTGTWTYSTSCSNTADTGLNNQIGTVNCTAYTGGLAIYQKGFVKVPASTRYFTYDDGTPFFYIGDTHWTMATEPYSTMFQPLVDLRVTQGFTVYQSEPIGVNYNLADGLTSADLAAFQDLDNRFQYIANAGLVHANAELFFTSELQNNGASYSTAYLQKLTRYWVARYASYPVIWTTAQECDNDFYAAFTPATNPWKTVFNALQTYDPYLHPKTAHQEYYNNGTTPVTTANSAFSGLTGYNWWGVQWSPTKDGLPGFSVAQDYWNNGGTRPAILYESHYENLWTNDFGARLQGWVAYLNGMYGYGYGAQDIWDYNTTYDENEDTVENSIITVTMAMKADTWSTSKNYAAATAVGTYMKSFFTAINWWQLTPRFNSTSYFLPGSGCYYSVASNSNTQYVFYFYNQTTTTGTAKGMVANAQYYKQWYNPRTGAYGTQTTVTANGSGQLTIGAKADSNDWVLKLTKV